MGKQTLKRQSKFLAYTNISIRTLMTKSSLLLGLFFMIVFGIGIGVYFHIKGFDINNFFSSSISNIQISNMNLIKIMCIIIIFVLFNTISGIMQDIVIDKDSNVIKQIVPLIHEKDYILAKLISAGTLALISILNLFLCFLTVILTLDCLNVHRGKFFIYLQKSITMLDIKEVLMFVVLLVAQFITLVLFTMLLAGRINNVQESSTNVLLILSPLLISFFILILPISVKNLTLISSILMFFPLLSVLFGAVNYTLIGLSAGNLICLLVSVFYIIVLYLINIKIYKFYLSSEKKFSLKEVIKLIIERN